MTTKDILYAAIIQNRKYRTIARAVITEAIEQHFARYPLQEKYLEKPASEKFKKIVRAIRGKLHHAYGAFQTTKKHTRKTYLESLKKILERHQLTSPVSLEIHNQILATNRSTQERLPHYATIYNQIFARTGKPNSILDLGCGLNPVSYPLMRIENVRYRCFDIDQEDVEFLNDYFHLIHLDGKASVLDLRRPESWKELPAADVALLFNLLDPLEHGKKGHKLAELLIIHIPARFLVISFSTQTISGKGMNYPQRGWIERMLTRIQYSFIMFETTNELFYIIQKVE
jgi:16S rRNA (guanine(1405)-N(7))-methyltransferase